MLMTAVLGVYLALLGVVAYDDLPSAKRFPGKSRFVLRA